MPTPGAFIENEEGPFLLGLHIIVGKKFERLGLGDVIIFNRSHSFLLGSIT